MANAMKCDRCGKYYENEKLVGEESASFSYTTYDHRISLEKGYKYRVSGHFDLCPACTQEIFKWLGIELKDDLGDTDGDIEEVSPDHPFADALNDFLRKSRRAAKHATTDSDIQNGEAERKRAILNESMEKWSWK